MYIPNGVDLDKFKSQNSKVKIINKGIKTILAVGAATEQKRLDLVIKAVAKLENINLLIASGGGDKTEEIKRLGKEALGERFEMVSVPFDKMPEIYRRADVFTLPSAQSESFGNVLVEAMASGLSVVATDDPIRREIVGDAGLFVDQTNIEEYARVLQKTLETNWEDKPRKQAEKFSWDEIAKKYNDLFAELTK
jgi:glycosyltransferase involved in cell wall biosynthesis